MCMASHIASNDFQGYYCKNTGCHLCMKRVLLLEIELPIKSNVGSNRLLQPELNLLCTNGWGPFLANSLALLTI